jgi:hypothetical protein
MTLNDANWFEDIQSGILYRINQFRELSYVSIGI